MLEPWTPIQAMNYCKGCGAPVMLVWCGACLDKGFEEEEAKFNAALSSGVGTWDLETYYVESLRSPAPEAPRNELTHNWDRPNTGWL